MLRLTKGTHWYCVFYWPNSKKEILVARPLKNWQAWLRVVPVRKVYRYAGMIVISWIGFEYRHRFQDILISAR